MQAAERGPPPRQHALCALPAFMLHLRCCCSMTHATQATTTERRPSRVPTSGQPYMCIDVNGLCHCMHLDVKARLE